MVRTHWNPAEGQLRIESGHAETVWLFLFKVFATGLTIPYRGWPDFAFKKFQLSTTTMIFLVSSLGLLLTTNSWEHLITFFLLVTLVIFIYFFFFLSLWAMSQASSYFFVQHLMVYQIFISVIHCVLIVGECCRFLFSFLCKLHFNGFDFLVRMCNVTCNDW